MTRITEDEQRDADVDWFAVDGAGHLAHFTSHGKPLPESVAASREDLRRLQTYFRRECAHRSTAHVDRALAEHVTFQSEDERDDFLHDFRAMGERGLYSYDVEDTGRGRWAYYRVVTPDRPLRLGDLPEELQVLLRRTTLAPVSFDRDAVLEDTRLLG